MFDNSQKEKITELKKFISQYNISDEDLIVMSENVNKMDEASFFGKEKFKKTLRDCKKKYSIAFLDWGGFIICFRNISQITNENLDSFHSFMSESQKEDNVTEKVFGITEDEWKESEKYYEELAPEMIKLANKKFKSKVEALTFAKINYEEVVDVSSEYISMPNRYNDNSQFENWTDYAPTVFEQIENDVHTDILFCLIVLRLTDKKGYLVDNIIEELESMLSSFMTSDEGIKELKKYKKKSDQALDKLKKAKEKLDLELITQGEYDKIKEDLKQYIS